MSKANREEEGEGGREREIERKSSTLHTTVLREVAAVSHRDLAACAVADENAAVGRQVLVQQVELLGVVGQLAVAVPAVARGKERLYH